MIPLQNIHKTQLVIIYIVQLGMGINPGCPSNARHLDGAYHKDHTAQTQRYQSQDNEPNPNMQCSETYYPKLPTLLPRH